ncbi:hypothetical protein NBRC10512_002874 [Rhodotorula toruloides]|uniref:RHTO0S13e04126g1_1 n=2 Tax=Rhodotorula toruloides TaxID=5286 RepID=A0A061BGD9_RHOTO|nr:nucleus export protein Brr6 [Rhodotorula toruloides NP11]EMS22408.1 nucleus export protein Brr6 [Rhodotorula toruloides NP11]CDR46963.1 RHTO0S13e04126g1_1 [Rhodotorula toruloides]
MRRFPAPSAHGGPSTPSARRSAEAPMQYEWEQPRQFPASPFASVARGGEGQEEGQPARKRTHYEAMDVDTPPRPSTSFPPSATATSDPFHFRQPFSASEPSTSTPPLSFDAAEFHPKEALGLAGEEEVQEVSMTAADESEMLDDEKDVEGKEEKALMLRRGGSETSSRRRQASGSSRRRSAHRSGETDDEGDDAHDGAGFLGVLKKTVGRQVGDSQFSFQVHHHHAPGMGGMQQQQHEAQPERWMRSSTPYVLLGYLQFGSLTLLAVLVLSLLSLFLYTLYTDIQARLAELTVELRSEIVQCAKAYVDNFCQEKRMPALARQCVEWEECMNKEVVVVGKTRVVAETLAEVVNGFVDVISLKTMLFVLLTLGITIYGSSVALSVLASRPSPPPPSPSPSAHPHFPHLSPYGTPAYPYGLPYNAAGSQWVVENDGGRKEQLGLGAPAEGRKKE